MISCHMFWLKRASNGRGFTTRPPTRSKPSGLFIQPLTAITLKEPVKPEMTTGTPDRKCARGDSRSQP